MSCGEREAGENNPTTLSLSIPHTNGRPSGTAASVTNTNLPANVKRLGTLGLAYFVYYGNLPETRLPLDDTVLIDHGTTTPPRLYAMVARKLSDLVEVGRSNLALHLSSQHGHNVCYSLNPQACRSRMGGIRGVMSRYSSR